MGDAGTLSVLAQDTLTGTGVQAVTGAKTFNNQKLLLRNPAGTKSLTLTNPTIVNDLPTQLNQYADFYIFIDIDDSNKIKAKENRTGAIKYNHATDAGVVFNSVIDDLVATAAAGGMIAVGPGTFNVTTTIIPKNLIRIVGAGESTIFYLPNTTNADIFKSFNFATLTGTNSQSGVQGVTLQDFTIDGNYTNNATSGYGIRYYGWNWKITNINIRNCRNDGIYSEWYEGSSIPSPYSMETYMVNVKVHHCQGVNIRDRGPHDSQWVNVICWAGVNGNVVCETLASTYSSGVMMIGCHFWSSNNDTVNFLIDGAQVFGAGIEAEGTHGTNGIGIKVTNSGKLKATGVKCFANVIGITLNSSANEVDGSFYSNTSKGMIIAANDNVVTGTFRTNTDMGLDMGATGSTQVNRNNIKGHFDDNGKHIKWWDSSSTDNFIIAHIETGGIETAMDTTSGTPNLTTNCLLIDSKGAGTNYTAATPLNTTNGVALTAANTFTETITINKTNVPSVSELLQQWGVDDDTTSYLKVENLSGSNAIFIPRFNALSNLPSSSTSSAIEIRGQLRATSDTGTTNPVIILDARLHTSTAAVVNRALVTIRNNATEVYSFFPSKLFSAKPIQAEDYIDNKVITIPADPATGYSRRYTKQVDANNDGLFVKRKINGAVVEVQL